MSPWESHVLVGDLEKKARSFLLQQDIVSICVFVYVYVRARVLVCVHVCVHVCM